MSSVSMNGHQQARNALLSAAELARKLNVPTNRITYILNGRRGITGDTALRLRNPAYVGVGRSRLGYSGGGRRRTRGGLCGRPRRCAPGVLRRSNRLPSNAEAATRG